MKKIIYRFVKPSLIALLFFSLTVAALGGGILFIDMPPQSEDFDCDDAVKIEYDRLTEWGLKPTIMLGDLKRTSESYMESDHVWLLVSLGPLNLPLDWGKLQFGRQYYEGYPVGNDKLEVFIRQDKEKKGSFPAKDGQNN